MRSSGLFVNFEPQHQWMWEERVWSDETNIEIFGISLTRCVWRKRDADYNPRTPSPRQHGGGNILLWGVSLLRGQEDFPAQRRGWTGPCTLTSWPIASFPQPGH
ncbi:hypothetical protein JOQ06_001880 [Pogonophryne albipinna]|uniref:Uncharacterized protein n=1 Tax=Pogonophryne albipinna TaxID=1090488 RepID=A0AAD6FJ69_9TELE|nr:hypothetical protein JOQ06_001880 [Pogonophryne albipinna]